METSTATERLLGQEGDITDSPSSLISIPEIPRTRSRNSGPRRARQTFPGLAFLTLALVAMAGASSVAISMKFFRVPSGTAGFGTSLTECSETYGFMPCSVSLLGNIFLMLGYGFLLLKAAQFISEGSEMLLEVLDPGVIGGLVLPVLGAFPDTLLVAVSGLGGTLEEAQEEVLVGMGVLAGSTIMVLTVAWAGSLVAGRCDLDGPGGTAVDRTLTKGFHLTETGVTTDGQTSVGAWIMIFSSITYIIMQLPLIFQEETEYGKLAAGVGLTLTILGFVAYCYYQVTQPWLQLKKIENAKLHYIRMNAIRNIHNLSLSKSWGGLLDLNGNPNYDALERVFRHFDLNDDELLTASELKALILGMNLSQEGTVPHAEEVNTWMKDFDVDNDGRIQKGEFFNGMKRWIGHVRPKLPIHDIDWDSHAGQSHLELKQILSVIEKEEAEEEEEGSKPKSASEIYREACLLMFAGACIVALFADPMVDSITNFSSVSGIPSFFVAFVVTPLASNSSELVSSILFAMKKRKRTISLTYSQVYGAITMNNTMVLGVFLALVYFRGITWQFSSEVTVILLTTLVVGVLGGTRTTFPLWQGIFVIAFYPLTIGIVAFLDYVLGWN